jgi:hypothetical protein
VVVGVAEQRSELANLQHQLTEMITPTQKAAL